MFKNLSKTTKFFAGLIGVVLIITVIIISISGNKTPRSTPVQYVNDNASADNKVEALKTMTADLLSVENKNKQLQQTVESLQEKNKAAISQLKNSVSSQVKQALNQIQQQNEQNQASFESSLKQKTEQSYPVNGESSASDFKWVSDLSASDAAKPKYTETKNNSDSELNLNNDTISLLHSGDNGSTQAKSKAVKPVYTIPVNATLTGATLMTPLVGRVPIDGQLSSPYRFKLVLSSQNLTANGYPMPGIQGAVMSGVASGDLLGSCARGKVDSITFIFNDGTISTTKTNNDNEALGYISSENGNPCISGTFHSNAAIFLGAQMALGAAEGYANAVTRSQYMSTTNSEGETLSTLIGDANKAGLGQAGSTASQAAQTWWNRRVQNSFDFVYVPNVINGHLMKVAVNITQQIDINRDLNARKVDYANSQNKINNKLD